VIAFGMELASMLARMRALLHTEFAALLARAAMSQAGFARLAGVTARQVNNWARGRAAVPRWAAMLAIALEQLSPDALDILLEETRFSCHELLGVPPKADAAALRRAMTRLALIYHPDKGGTPEQMVAVNAAYTEALDAIPRPRRP
jgi:transcriptional regulator with XRE-family HTH domain